MKKLTLLYILLTLATGAILAEEPVAVTRPSACHEAEITELVPYPVTTESTDTTKWIYMMDGLATVISGSEVIVGYADGQYYRYMADDRGRVALQSNQTIQSIIISRWGDLSDSLKDMWPKANALLVRLHIGSAPTLIDLADFPADVYVLVVESTRMRISE